VLAIFVGSATLISQPVEVRATEGHFFDDRGKPSKQPDRWKSLAAIGSAALGNKRYDVAIRFLSAALEGDLKSKVAAHLYGLRGDAYVEKGEIEKALADYARALNFVPKNSSDYVTRGGIYEKMGNYNAAASDYAKGIALSPDDGETLNALAWLRATCPEASVRDGHEAIRLGTKLCELTRWKEWWPIDTLAAAYAEVRNFDEAAKLEGRALQMRNISPGDRKEAQERLVYYQQHKPYREPLKVRGQRKAQTKRTSGHSVSIRNLVG